MKMGIYDNPLNQEQPFFNLDIYKHNVAIFGGPMTGKTTFIKTLLVRMNQNADIMPEENTYIIDFSGNIGEYSNLNNICACYDNTNEENIKRIFITIEKKLAENARKLGSSNYLKIMKKGISGCPTHLTLIIENVTSFLTDERYSIYQERLLRLCRDGLSKGLSIIITSNETVGIRRLMTYFGQKVAFEMPSDNYFEIFDCKVDIPMRLPGRGIINVESSTYEFQCFLPFANETELNNFLSEYGNKRNRNRLISFDEDLTIKNYQQYCGTDFQKESNVGLCFVGLDYYEHKPVTFDINEISSIAIYGKRGSEKLNLLNIILKDIINAIGYCRIVFLDDGRKELEKNFSSIGCKVEFMKTPKELLDFLKSDRYIVDPIKKEDEEKTAARPFTVFVLHSKSLYQTSTEARYLMGQVIPELVGNAEDMGCKFVFSDTRVSAIAEIRPIFINCIRVAFLLDSIGDFVADKGNGNKSVFGEMDVKELKEEYAKCGVGDGFFYDTELEELKKLKFLQCIK